MRAPEWKVGDRALMAGVPEDGEVTLTAVGKQWAEHEDARGRIAISHLTALRPVPARTHVITVDGLTDDEVRARAELLRRVPAFADPDEWTDPGSKASARINAALLAYAEEHGL